jgi:anti-sigma regulatory factor (Ser/Thr protein kinase)
MFEATPEAAGLARRQVAGLLSVWGHDGDRADDLVLICSELVTNAVVHAGAPGGTVRVVLQEVDGDCRLEVLDSRPDLHLPQQPITRTESGRGLLLVRELADDMDVATTQRCKTVWARVLLPRSARPRARA